MSLDDIMELALAILLTAAIIMCSVLAMSNAPYLFGISEEQALEIAHTEARK